MIVKRFLFVLILFICMFVQTSVVVAWSPLGYPDDCFGVSSSVWSTSNVSSKVYDLPGNLEDFVEFSEEYRLETVDDIDDGADGDVYLYGSSFQRFRWSDDLYVGGSYTTATAVVLVFDYDLVNVAESENEFKFYKNGYNSTAGTICYSKMNALNKNLAFGYSEYTTDVGLPSSDVEAEGNVDYTGAAIELGFPGDKSVLNHYSVLVFLAYDAGAGVDTDYQYYYGHSSDIGLGPTYDYLTFESDDAASCHFFDFGFNVPGEIAWFRYDDIDTWTQDETVSQNFYYDEDVTILAAKETSPSVVYEMMMGLELDSSSMDDVEDLDLGYESGVPTSTVDMPVPSDIDTDTLDWNDVNDIEDAYNYVKGQVTDKLSNWLWFLRWNWLIDGYAGGVG